MKNVLILGVMAIQMDAILTLKKLDCKVYACARAKDGLGADCADEFIQLDFMKKDLLVELIKEKNIDVVYSVGSDLAMPLVNEISEELGMVHFVSADSADICNHKWRLRESLGDSQWNVPYQILTQKDVIKLNFPVIMKPSDSSGQRGIHLINSQTEFDQYFDSVREMSRERKVIVEKYINGPELSVNAYMVDGKVVFCFASDRVTWPQFTGLIHSHVIPSKYVDEQTSKKIFDLVQETAVKLNILNGPVYYQIKVEGNTPYVVEITPRHDGCHMWKLIKNSMGIDLMKLTFEHLLFNDTSELNNLNDTVVPYFLEFFCQEPNTTMIQEKFTVPEDAVDHFFFYQTGQNIRSINGLYDKVGYYIKQGEYNE